MDLRPGALLGLPPGVPERRSRPGVLARPSRPARPRRAAGRWRGGATAPAARARHRVGRARRRLLDRRPGPALRRAAGCRDHALGRGRERGRARGGRRRVPGRRAARSIAVWSAAARRLGARPVLLAPTPRPAGRVSRRSRSSSRSLWGRPRARWPRSCGWPSPRSTWTWSAGSPSFRAVVDAGLPASPWRRMALALAAAVAAGALGRAPPGHRRLARVLVVASSLGHVAPADAGRRPAPRRPALGRARPDRVVVAARPRRAGPGRRRRGRAPVRRCGLADAWSPPRSIAPGSSWPRRR